jgi:hypothetical protein
MEGNARQGEKVVSVKIIRGVLCEHRVKAIRKLVTQEERPPEAFPLAQNECDAFGRPIGLFDVRPGEGAAGRRLKAIAEGALVLKQSLWIRDAAALGRQKCEVRTEVQIEAGAASRGLNVDDVYGVSRRAP